MRHVAGHGRHASDRLVAGEGRQFRRCGAVAALERDQARGVDRRREDIHRDLARPGRGGIGQVDQLGDLMRLAETRETHRQHGSVRSWERDAVRVSPRAARPDEASTARSRAKHGTRRARCGRAVGAGHPPTGVPR
jgi:hypothetical protein